jgi:hypothetical protein
VNRLVVGGQGESSAMEGTRFQYLPRCSFSGCAEPAQLKVAAAWSDGTFQELKTYALSCEAHLEPLREAAVRRRSTVRLTEGESLEPIAVYRLDRQSRDADLPRHA